MTTERLTGHPPTDLPPVLDLADVVTVELNAPLPNPIASTRPHVLIIALLCGQPLGMVFAPVAEVATPADLARAISAQLGHTLAALAPLHGLDPTLSLGPGGLAHERCPVRDERERLARTGPPASVLICTRERPDFLRRCLASLQAVDYHDFEVIVVDNNPVTDATRQVCSELEAWHRDGEPVLRYLVENRPGVSQARNLGVAEAKHDVIAFVDDDERVDRGWLSGLVAEFVADERVGVASGVVLPAELETDAQVRFEQFGGLSKGRGFARVIFDAEYLASVQSAMYPLPPFGAGANMAFRRAAINGIGGFDVALGVGTPTRGGEDTLAYTELLLAGWRMAYTPSAITWHYHRRRREDIDRQLSGYGLGLGAYYVALVMADPRRLVTLARLLPQAMHDLRAPDSPRNASSHQSSDPVPGLSLRAIVIGAWRYTNIRLRVVLQRPQRWAGEDTAENRG